MNKIQGYGNDRHVPVDCTDIQIWNHYNKRAKQVMDLNDFMVLLYVRGRPVMQLFYVTWTSAELWNNEEDFMQRLYKQWFRLCFSLMSAADSAEESNYWCISTGA